MWQVQIQRSGVVGGGEGGGLVAWGPGDFSAGWVEGVRVSIARMAIGECGGRVWERLEGRYGMVVIVVRVEGILMERRGRNDPRE
jgi:hypothetical protein